MTIAWALLLGFGLGLRHAADPDHVAAIGALLEREASPRRAERMAALRGVGHTLSFFTIGALVIVAEIRVPREFERAGEAGVALLALMTIRSTVGALCFLVLFGVGTVLAMTLLTALLSIPVGWSVQQWRGSRTPLAAAAMVSIGLGLALAAHLVKN